MVTQAPGSRGAVCCGGHSGGLCPSRLLVPCLPSCRGAGPSEPPLLLAGPLSLSLLPRAWPSVGLGLSIKGLLSGWPDAQGLRLAPQLLVLGCGRAGQLGWPGWGDLALRVLTSQLLGLVSANRPLGQETIRLSQESTRADVATAQSCPLYPLWAGRQGE